MKHVLPVGNHKAAGAGTHALVQANNHTPENLEFEIDKHSPSTYKVNTMSHSELATSYAALILADDDVDITVSVPNYVVTLCLFRSRSIKPDKLQTLIKAANVEDVESIWTTLFAKVIIVIAPSVTIRPYG